MSDIGLSLSPASVLALDLVGASEVQVYLTAQQQIDAAGLSAVATVEADLGRFTDGLGARQKIQRVDNSRPIAYAGFASEIKRLDYATWPPVITTAETSDLNRDWETRSSLTYE